MTQQECASAYQELVEILRELNLGWLVERVETTLLRGKALFKETNGKSYPYFEPYSQREQLFLLIDAVEKALIETVAMEEEIAKSLRAENMAPKVVWADDSGKSIHDYRPEIISVKKQNADVLKGLLEELRRDALANVN
ncbi:MAG: hypothetical protein SXA11_05565 [Cyanobacteriota bacterium]|nr:hypothetical protein [Cyanobacteriota bacterium]